jgi:pyruvate dehydrogenase (quinone)
MKFPNREIGAQQAFPDRQVISLSGDGGFTMLMGDFLTLVQHDLPVKVVVFNNGSLGFIEIEQKSSGFLDTGTTLKNPNFAAMAENPLACAGSGWRIQVRLRPASPMRSPMTGLS